MRWIRPLVAALMLSVCLAAASAQEAEMLPLVCPVCGTAFDSPTLDAGASFGNTDEGRPLYLGDDAVAYRLHCCPGCNYTAYADDFKSGSPDAPAAADLPTPEQAQAIRAAIAARKDLAPPRGLLPIERVQAAILAAGTRGAAPHDMLYLCLLGAWACDDEAEEDRGSAFRRMALAETAKAVADNRTSDADRLMARYLDAVLTRNLGDPAAALKLLLVLPERVDVVLAKLLETQTGLSSQESPDEAAMAKVADDIETVEGIQSAVAEETRVTRMMIAGRDAALAQARGGGVAEKGSFMDAFGRDRDPVTRAAIDEFLAHPMGTAPTAATEEERARWAESEQSARGKLQLIDLRNTWLLGRLGISPDVPEAAEPPKPTADLAKRLAELRTQLADPEADPEGSLAAEADSIVATLIARKDKDAAAALLADLAARPAWYAQNYPGIGEGPESVVGQGPYLAMAADGKAALQLADRMLQQAADGQAAGLVAAVLLTPLAYVNDPAAVATLKRAVASEDMEIRLQAAKCLLPHGEAAGKNALLTNALGHSVIADLTGTHAAVLLARMVDKNDFEKLYILRAGWGMTEDGQELPNREDQIPVWIAAAMAAADPARGEKQYESLLDQLSRLAVAPQAAAKPAGGHDSPLSALLEAAALRYTPQLGKILRALLDRTGDPEDFRTILWTLRDDQLPEAIASMLGRPLPLAVKQEICMTADLSIPGVKAALEKWSHSPHVALAAAAKEALATEGKPEP